jgi:hypothetical protein
VAVINYAGGGVMVGTIIAEAGVTLSSPANSTTLPGAGCIKRKSNFISFFGNYGKHNH